MTNQNLSQRDAALEDAAKFLRQIANDGNHTAHIDAVVTTVLRQADDILAGYDPVPLTNDQRSAICEIIAGAVVLHANAVKPKQPWLKTALKEFKTLPPLRQLAYIGGVAVVVTVVVAAATVTYKTIASGPTSVPKETKIVRPYGEEEK